MQIMLRVSLVGLTAATLHSTATSSPVEKVVQLLNDLKKGIEEDGGAEQQVYDKFACWCEKTTGRKAAAIVDANNQIRSLGQQILSLKGKVATLGSEIEELST